MGNISAVLSESYEDVLAAVQESERGRWFLGEFAARQRSQETKTVLDAIHKLESVVATVPVSNTTTPAIERVKSAIELARQQLGALKPEGKLLSEEAQVFAHLAKLSQQAMAAEAPQALRESVGKGLNVALNFVQALENDFGIVPQTLQKAPEIPVVSQTPKPAAETQKYFHQDSDVFAPTPTSVSNGVQFKAPVNQKPNEEQVGRGARLTIHKYESQSTSGQPEAVPANNEPVTHQPTAEDERQEQKPRIVIVRRKPEELSAIPLAESSLNESAA